MKAKVTMKEIKRRYKRIFLVESQKYELFRLLESDYCTAGVYGWNADFWDFGGILFVDGYRPFFTDRVSDFPALVSFFEKSNKELASIEDWQARKIRAVNLSLKVYNVVQKMEEMQNLCQRVTEQTKYALCPSIEGDIIEVYMPEVNQRLYFKKVKDIKVNMERHKAVVTFFEEGKEDFTIEF